MTFDWQLIVALILVALAAGYVAFGIGRSLIGKRSGCGGCGTCSARKSGEAGPERLVMLGKSDEIAERS